MSKQITITISDEIYESLVNASEYSMRPLALEAVFRIREGLGRENTTENWDIALKKMKEGVTEEYLGRPRVQVVPLELSEDEKIIIEELTKIYSDGYQPDSEELSRLNRMISDAGCEYWDAKKTLFRITSEGKKVIKKF